METSASVMEFYRQVFRGAWITQGIAVAAELGIADLLADAPRTAEELAKETRAHSQALYRLMRALASAGIFVQDEDGRFSLSPLAYPLRTDGAGSQRAFAAMMGGELQQAWGQLLHSVRTGEPGFQARFGKPFFEYMTEHPDRHSLFDAAMTGIHDAETQPILDAYDFGSFQTVVDIGGGSGLQLAAALQRHPALHGILFDLPAVAERARATVADLGLSERCRVEGGDFFASVPAGADAYVLRHIVHDWQDLEAATLLRNCRDAMAPGGKVLVMESVIPGANEPCFGKWLDLMMLLVGGRERTEEEYRRLFGEAGLTLNRIVPTAAEISILEGVRTA